MSISLRLHSLPEGFAYLIFRVHNLVAGLDRFEDTFICPVPECGIAYAKEFLYLGFGEHTFFLGCLDNRLRSMRTIMSISLRLHSLQYSRLLWATLGQSAS